MATLPYWTPGNIAEIKLNGAWSYAQVIKAPLMGFYAPRSEKLTSVSSLEGEDFQFKIWVMKYALGKKGWPIIGHLELTEKQQEGVWFSKKDPISKRFKKYHSLTSVEVASTLEECIPLECAAVWDPIHIESRLIDALAGVPNKWVESLRAK
jgi:hypothetical protein